MPGSADLDPNVLVDGLVPVIDGLREDLHPAFGVRAYRAFVVRRTWSGELPGEGVMTPSEIEIRPQPKVEAWDKQSGRKWDLSRCGVEELGQIKLSEISLTYTEEEITGRPLPKNVELLWRLEDAHGQGSRSKLFRPERPPFVDREKSFGWIVFLRSVAEGE